MKLYLKYFSIHLKSQMQYKGSFLMTVAGQFLLSFSALLSIWFLFSRFHTVAGFSFQEVLLCFAIILMAFSLAECFVRGFDTFSNIIGNGEFDRILIRPRNTVFQVLASKVELSRIGRLIQALVVFLYAIPTSDVLWTGDKILLLGLMILSGMSIFSGLFVIYAALCFFTTEGLEFMNVLTDGGREFGGYPVVIYGKQILKFLTYIVPIALFQYYPFLYLIGRTESILHFLAPICALLFLLPCYGIWRLGLRHYKSTGS